MKPVKFKHHNAVYATSQAQYRELPAIKFDALQGEVVACWKLSFIERLALLFTGKVWVKLLTFGNKLTPHQISIIRRELYTVEGDEKRLDTKIVNFINKLRYGR